MIILSANALRCDPAIECLELAEKYVVKQSVGKFFLENFAKGPPGIKISVIESELWAVRSIIVHSYTVPCHLFCPGVQLELLDPTIAEPNVSPWNANSEGAHPHENEENQHPGTQDFRKRHCWPAPNILVQ
jgi:hypothetical protein